MYLVNLLDFYPVNVQNLLGQKNITIGKIASVVHMKLSFYSIFKQSSCYRRLPKIQVVFVLRNEAVLITYT